MQRNRETLSGPVHDRTPPTQRLADPAIRADKGGQGSASGPDETGDSQRFYATVLDKSSTQQLRLPKTDGTSQSYR